MKPGMRHLIGADEEGKRAAAKNRRGTELMQEGLQTVAASSENWKSTAAKSQQASLQNTVILSCQQSVNMVEKYNCSQYTASNAKKVNMRL